MFIEDDIVEYLNFKERRAYNQRKIHGGELFGYDFFRPNRIRTIPDELVNLKLNL